MSKKLGPLPLWQWLAIGAAVGVVYYLYKARQAGTSVTPPATATTGATDLGPIDPTTGVPYAIEGSGSGGIAGGTVAQNAGPTSLGQELSDLGAIEGLFAGLPVATSGGANGTTSPTNITVQLVEQGQKAVKKAAGVVRKTAAPKRHHTPSGVHNPGHTITHHPGGKKTVSSTAPHSSQQHVNVQPPNHQRANPVKHHTAGNPPKRPRHAPRKR